jgi:hypothetical protein
MGIGDWGLGSVRKFIGNRTLVDGENGWHLRQPVKLGLAGRLEKLTETSTGPLSLSHLRPGRNTYLIALIRFED